MIKVALKRERGNKNHLIRKIGTSMYSTYMVRAFKHDPRGEEMAASDTHRENKIPSK